MIRRNTSLGSRVFDIANHLALFLLCVLMLYPFWYVLVASVTAPQVVAVARGALLWPSGWTIGAYRRVFENPIVGRAYLNTLI